MKHLISKQLFAVAFCGLNSNHPLSKWANNKSTTSELASVHPEETFIGKIHNYMKQVFWEILVVFVAFRSTLIGKLNVTIHWKLKPIHTHFNGAIGNIQLIWISYSVTMRFESHLIACFLLAGAWCGQCVQHLAETFNTWGPKLKFNQVESEFDRPSWFMALH